LIQIRAIPALVLTQKKPNLKMEDPNKKNSKLPKPIDAAAALRAPRAPKIPIIPKLLYAGEKMILGGSPKDGKSWVVLFAGIAVATGTPWLGRPTTKKKVIILNMELSEDSLLERLEFLCNQLGITLQPGDLEIYTLRGEDVDMDTIVKGLSKAYPIDPSTGDAAIGLIIPDPIYKLLDGADENNGKDINALLRKFEVLIKNTGAAILYTHHFSKYNKGKEMMDQFSGSSVWVRDADVIAALTPPASDDECRQIHMRLRNHATPPPIQVTLKFPRDEMTSAVASASPKPADSEVIKVNSPEQKKNPTVEDVITLLTEQRDADPGKSGVWSSGQIRALIKEQGWNDGGYSKTVAEAVDKNLLVRVNSTVPNQKLYRLATGQITES